MAFYATAEEFATYVEGFTLDETNTEGVERALERAERDIDQNLPGVPEANGLKAVLTELTEYQVLQLSRATCAQAEYRMTLGENFFVEDQRESVQGPDHTETGRVGRVGPKAREELLRGGLVRMAGRMA